MKEPIVTANKTDNQVFGSAHLAVEGRLFVVGASVALCVCAVVYKACDTVLTALAAYIRPENT